MSAAVSDASRFHFETLGYLVLPGVIDTATRDQVKAVLADLEGRDFPEDEVWQRHLPEGQAHPTRTTYEDHQLRLNGLPNLDPVFDQFIAHPVVLPYLEDFVGEAQLINTWYIRKQQGPRSSWWHRGFGPDDYSCRDGVIRSRMLNTAWLLDDNGPDDGCLLAVPGSHKSNLTLDYTKYPGLQLPGSVAVTAKAGDVVLFSESVLHCGDEKRTPGLRRNLYFNYLQVAAIGSFAKAPGALQHACLTERVRSRLDQPQRQMTAWMQYLRRDPASL